MRLAQYLKERKITIPQFAADSRIPVQTIYSILNRPWIVPHADLALRIIEATGGAVTLQDLVKTSKYPRRGSRPADPPVENDSQQTPPACG